MQKLLKLIETVDPSDTDTLDEIDARVWCWLGVQGFDENRCRFDLEFSKMKFAPKYTRSRDSLKAVRPERCTVQVTKYVAGWAECCLVTEFSEWDWTNGFKCLTAPTEELAELHAIIQAIQWERDNEH